jgi:alcohol dehydrogenase class IV
MINTKAFGDSAAAGLSVAKHAASLAIRFVPIPQPTLLVGPGASERLGQAIGDFGHRKILLVTDSVISKLKLADPLIDALKKAGTPVVVFDQVPPDAPIPVIVEAAELFKREGCDAIVAFGGGSPMDAAKAVALVAVSGKHPRKLAGYFRSLRGPVPIYAVPTTAGTGSETTVAAVISDPERRKKLVIVDFRVVPKMAALDPGLMTGLPPAITAATGMDALTHAVEAVIGYWNSPDTDRLAFSAVSMISQNLVTAFKHGGDLQAREKMALAANYAGQAFTRANVGNVHAIAHQLGGLYHTPHGLANAILLPRVLRFSSAAITEKLAKLAVHAHFGQEGDSREALAQKFLDGVEALNRTLKIPKTLEALQEEDIPELAAAACREADLNYPVPRRMTQADCEGILREILPKQ